jgi:hypothetical protein
MREPDFIALEAELIKCGIVPRDTRQLVNELRDHYDDLIDASVDAGANSREARRVASEQLGSIEDFVSAISARRELKGWAFRYPRAAILMYPVACLALLPAVPVFAGIAHAETLARWGLSLVLAGLMTASMLLFMQFSILLG